MIVKHKHKTTDSSHGGGADHFSSGFLRLPDLVVFVIKILKNRRILINSLKNKKGFTSLAKIYLINRKNTIILTKYSTYDLSARNYGPEALACSPSNRLCNLNFFHFRFSTVSCASFCHWPGHELHHRWLPVLTNNCHRPLPNSYPCLGNGLRKAKEHLIKYKHGSKEPGYYISVIKV